MDALNRVCNVSLPWNAINTAHLKQGMRFSLPFDHLHRVFSAEKTIVRGDRVIVVTNEGQRQAHIAGTFRLEGVTPEEYDYHRGHGCSAEGMQLRTTQFLKDAKEFITYG